MNGKLSQIIDKYHNVNVSVLQIYPYVRRSYVGAGSLKDGIISTRGISP